MTWEINNINNFNDPGEAQPQELKLHFSADVKNLKSMKNVICQVANIYNRSIPDDELRPGVRLLPSRHQ